MNSLLAQTILGTLAGMLIISTPFIGMFLPVLWCYKLGDGVLGTFVYFLSMFATWGLCAGGAWLLIEAAS